jgi:hypothetical protein
MDTVLLLLEAHTAVFIVGVQLSEYVFQELDEHYDVLFFTGS